MNDNARRLQKQLEDAHHREVRDAVAPLYGDIGFEEKRYKLLDRADLRSARERNNVDRPSLYGYLIDDLLTTAGFHLLRSEMLERIITRYSVWHGEAIDLAKRVIPASKMWADERDVVREMANRIIQLEAALLDSRLGRDKTATYPDGKAISPQAVVCNGCSAYCDSPWPGVREDDGNCEWCRKD